MSNVVKLQTLLFVNEVESIILDQRDISNGLRLTTLTEYKCQQQFSEQLSGGSEAMRRAVSRKFGKEVSTAEMRQMMKDGKLISKEILPFLAEEMSVMARRGGALEVALKALNAVTERMSYSFDMWKNSVYQGGLNEALLDLYKTVDRIFAFSAGGEQLGKFLKGFIGQARATIEWIHDRLVGIKLFIEDLGYTGADVELLGKIAYWASLVGMLNTVAGLMKIIFGGTVLNGIMSVTGKLLGLKVAVEGVTAAQTAATVATTTATSSGWIAMLLSQSKLLLAALAPVAAAVAAIAAAAAVLNLAQNKYDSMSPTQQADWQQKMTQLNTRSTLMSSGAGGSMLPNTNPYAPMMQAVADTNRQLQETIINAPPLRVDVRVEESELSKFIKFRVDEGIQRQVQSILPTGAPSLVTK